MAEVAITVADYLRSEALFTSAATPSGVAWADRGVESEIISPLYDKADADAEATREAAFLAGPLVEDVVLVKGARRDLMLCTIQLTGNQIGYSGAAVPAFVIGFAELEGATQLTVLRSLA